MLRLSNLKEWMLVHLFNFTSVTEVKVATDTALVANALNRANTTAVTGYSVVDLRCLVSSSLTEVVNHQSLESLSGIGLDFLLDNLNKICVELVLKSTRAIASSARHSLLVDFRAIALEAHDAFIVRDGLFLILWSENLAVNLLRDSLGLELASLALSLNRTITESFAHILESLRAAVLSVNYGVKLLFVSLDRVSVATEVLNINNVSRGLGVDSLRVNWNLEGALTSNSNAMLLLVREGLLFFIPANILELLADAIIITALHQFTGS